MGALIFIAFIVAVFLTWFFIHKSKEEERKLLIEKGVDIADLPDRKTFHFNFPWLKIGTIITFIATGGLISGILEFFVFKIPQEWLGLITVFSLFIFGGIGMITAHYLDKPNDKS